MITKEHFDRLALSFHGAVSAPHFDRTAYKVTGKRIFASLHEASRSANIKLSPEEQAEFCGFSPDSVSPVPNKWGEQGWTTFQLETVSEDLLKTALEAAYQAVIAKL